MRFRAPVLALLPRARSRAAPRRDRARRWAGPSRRGDGERAFAVHRRGGRRTTRVRPRREGSRPVQSRTATAGLSLPAPSWRGGSSAAKACRRISTRAVRLHERARQLRDAASCVNAARMYASGRGVPPSRARQVELLGLACMLGDGTACTIPAKAFADGRAASRVTSAAPPSCGSAPALAGDEAACAEVERPPP